MQRMRGMQQTSVWRITSGVARSVKKRSGYSKFLTKNLEVLQLGFGISRSFLTSAASFSRNSSMSSSFARPLTSALDGETLPCCYAGTANITL